ncbi:MAG TPA: hypothetical protein VN688_15600 [Gemmataceae bacterium]|nr:hypothetical protein [Gemmataceae bacterium]
MTENKMSHSATTGTNMDEEGQEVSLEEPLPTANDPGGAHAKGYSADPRPEKEVKQEDPIPLATGHDSESAVRQPEREGKVRPTGRSEPGGYSPNDRLMGSDR